MMKKTMAALVIGTIFTAEAAQAERVTKYQCTERGKSEPTIMLGEPLMIDADTRTTGIAWVEWNEAFFAAHYVTEGVTEGWIIMGTDGQQQFQVLPNGGGGFTDFGNAEEGDLRETQLQMRCEPVN